MKLKLKKKKIKNLSRDNKALPAEMTPQVGGGLPPAEPDMTTECHTPMCSWA